MNYILINRIQYSEMLEITRVNYIHKKVIELYQNISPELQLKHGTLLLTLIANAKEDCNKFCFSLLFKSCKIIKRKQTLIKS